MVGRGSSSAAAMARSSYRCDSQRKRPGNRCNPQRYANSGNQNAKENLVRGSRLGESDEPADVGTRRDGDVELEHPHRKTNYFSCYHSCLTFVLPCSGVVRAQLSNRIIVRGTPAVAGTGFDA